MSKYLEYDGDVYRLEDPNVIEYLNKVAKKAGLTYKEFLTQARNLEAIETQKKDAYAKGQNFRTKSGFEIYPALVQDGEQGYRYALTNKPIIRAPEIGGVSKILPPKVEDKLRLLRGEGFLEESGEPLQETEIKNEEPTESQEPSPEETKIVEKSEETWPELTGTVEGSEETWPELTGTVEESAETWPELSNTTEESTAEPEVTTPASTDDAFKEAMMKYYQDKDAKGGTKLAEWARNFDKLARRNYENQIRRNPELANPAQSFKDSWVSDVFNRSLSASDAQLPDFAPGSSNLNYSKRAEVENSPNMSNEYNDFSRNNVTPKEVMEQNFDVMGDMEIEGVDYSKLYKSFEPYKLF